MKNLRSNRGATLLELIAAVAVLSIVGLAAFTLLMFSIRTNNFIVDGTVWSCSLRTRLILWKKKQGRNTWFPLQPQTETALWKTFLLFLWAKNCYAVKKSFAKTFLLFKLKKSEAPG